MAGSSKTLRELINSSALVTSKYGVHGYGPASLSKRTFGTVYYNKKVAYYNKEYNVLELRMVFGADEDKLDDVHVVRIVFVGLDKDKIKICKSIDELNKEIDKEYKRKDKRRAAKVQKMLEDPSEDVLEKTALEKSIKGVIVPCTVAPANSTQYADYFRPTGEYLYYSGDITLDTRCAVSCSCPSYKYTFAEYNYRAGVHAGIEPEAYINTAKAWNVRQPKLNVSKRPGLCKHLLLFAMMLAKGDILKGFFSDDLTNTAKTIRKIEKQQRGEVAAKLDDNLRDEINKIPDKIAERDSADKARQYGLDHEDIISAARKYIKKTYSAKERENIDTYDTRELYKQYTKSKGGTIASYKNADINTTLEMFKYAKKGRPKGRKNK